MCSLTKWAGRVGGKGIGCDHGASTPEFYPWAAAVYLHEVSAGHSPELLGHICAPGPRVLLHQMNSGL